MNTGDMRKLADEAEPNEISPAIYEAMHQAADEIDSLRAKLAECERVRDKREEQATNLGSDLRAVVAKLVAVEKDRDAATTSQAEDLMTCVRAVQKSEAREAILREALEWYADDENYGHDGDPCEANSAGQKGCGSPDNGNRARAALAKAKP